MKYFNRSKSEDLHLNGKIPYSHRKMDHLSGLPDNIDEKNDEKVEEDVRTYSILIKRDLFVVPDPRTDSLNLQTPAQRPRHLQLMEQKY